MEVEEVEMAEEKKDQPGGEEMMEVSEGDVNISSVERSIIKQVEYYFGDINWSRDKFLQEEIKKGDGWVEINTMLTFNRLAELTTDPAVVAEALTKSKLVEVSADCKKIRRNPAVPLPENSLEFWQAVKRRSVYIKGFARNATLDEIQAFAKKFGEVHSVLMRKSEKRKFNGAVFVAYSDIETALSFVNNNVYDFNGTPITKLMLKEYWMMKNNERKAIKAANRAAKFFKKATNKNKTVKSQGGAQFVEGLILAVGNLPSDSNKCNFPTLKKFFKQFGDVAYIAYEKGAVKARIRFAGDKNAAFKAWREAVAASVDAKVVFGGNEISGRVLVGVEEEQYWDEYNKRRAQGQERFGEESGCGRGSGRWHGYLRAGTSFTRSTRAVKRDSVYGQRGSSSAAKKVK